jgi:hypothetical protein
MGVRLQQIRHPAVRLHEVRSRGKQGLKEIKETDVQS